MNKEQSTQIKLPERLVGSVDLSRALRELKDLDEWLNQMALRQPGQPMKLPKTSATLDELAALNEASLLDPKHREHLVMILNAFSAHAPRIHMSFAAEPSAAFIGKIVFWLRTNINPVILLEVGLQPTIAAGCTVRTSNKIFDMSLRHRFTDNRRMLVEKIIGDQSSAKAEKTAEIPAPEAPAQAEAKP